MTWQNVKNQIPKIAASAIAQYVVVANDPAVDTQCFTAGSVGQDGIGVNLATVATYGYAAAVANDGVVKILVVASCGAGQRVAVASTNGGVGPIVGSGLATALGSALGAAGARYSIGTLQEARAAGEYGAVHIDPRQVI